MEEGIVEGETAFVADGEATEVSQPGEGALDLPTLAIPTKSATVLAMTDFRCAASVPSPLMGEGQDGGDIVCPSRSLFSGH